MGHEFPGSIFKTASHKWLIFIGFMNDSRSRMGMIPGPPKSIGFIDGIDGKKIFLWKYAKIRPGGGGESAPAAPPPPQIRMFLFLRIPYF